jgi:hypothetical protein
MDEGCEALEGMDSGSVKKECRDITNRETQWNLESAVGYSLVKGNYLCKILLKSLPKGRSADHP